MAKAYRLTASRKRALRKAQLISARKRRGKGKPKRKLSRNQRRAAIGVAGVSAAVLTGTGAYARHKASGSKIIGPIGPRTATPTINIAGVQLPGTRAGIRVHRYKGEGFAITGVHRNKKGDKHVFTYRHNPLTKEAVKAMVGMKVKSGPNDGWQPRAARQPGQLPDGFNNEIFQQAALQRTGKHAALTVPGRRHRASGFMQGRGGAQARNKLIPFREALARAEKYKLLMAESGTTIDPDHLYYVQKEFSKLKY